MSNQLTPMQELIETLTNLIELSSNENIILNSVKNRAIELLPKESIEEENPLDFLMTNLYKKGYLKEVDGNEPINLMNVAKEKLKQTLYTEDEVNEYLEYYLKTTQVKNEIALSISEWFNKHKKQ